jgi:glycosyltransferase involved in cell wall biosynthesis
MATSRIRTLYLQPAPLFGGAERQATEQAMFLPELGVDPIVVGGPGAVIGAWMKRAPAGRFVHSPNFPDTWAHARGLARLTVSWRYIATGLRAQAEFLELVQKERIDIIVASLPFAWIVGTLVARKAGIPVVWRAGGIDVPLLQRMGLWCLTRFLRPDLLICNGEAVRRVFAPLVGAPVLVVPNGVNSAVFNANTGDGERFRPPGARAVVGFAGRLARTKHPEALIALAARLEKTHPNVHVLVAGDGPERSRSEATARRLGLTNLSFLGFVEDMPSFYAACDIVVLPTDTEGCSNVVLEAMMSEKAIVSADIPPMLELVQHGETGLVYQRGDTVALADAVTGLLARPDARRKLARRAREWALGFGSPVAARKLAVALQGVVAKERARRAPERSVIPFPTSRPSLAKVPSIARPRTR